MDFTEKKDKFVNTDNLNNMKKVSILPIAALIALSGCNNSTPPKVTTYQVNGFFFKMIDVNGGKFKMGAHATDPEKDNFDTLAYDYEGPVHKVVLGDFSMGETEVTQGLWKAVMKDSSHFNSENGLGDNMPVYFISFNEALQFISALNDSLHASKQLTEDKNVSLPTEAQWEYAARGGNLGNNYKHSGSDDVEEVGWYEENSDDKLHAVMLKKPNELGIYDLSGNVWEWCSDFKGDYPACKQKDPTGPEKGSLHVLRGGGYGYDLHGCRNTCRGYNVANYKDRNLGFRIVIK